MRSKPPAIAASQQLRSVPVRNQRAITHPRTADGTIEVEVGLRYSPLLTFFRRALKARTSRRFLLDRLGCELYEAIDGVKTFEQLVDEFRAAHRLTFFEARAFVMQYLGDLADRGIIAIVVPATDRSA